MIKLPEPAGHHYHDDATGTEVAPPTPFFNSDHLKQAIRDALEEAAKVCESQWTNIAEKMYGAEIAAAIRALKESPPPTA